MRRLLGYVVVALSSGALVACGTGLPASPPGPGSTDRAAARPFPQHVDYPARAIRPSHVSQKVMDAAVEKHYRRWKASYVRTDGGEGAWIEYDGKGSTVSEAHGYGMVLAAYLADKATFDALFEYYTNHPSRHGEHLMAWKQTLRDGVMRNVEGRFSATDGDLDIAYALLLAHEQWGSDGGVDYRARALDVMGDILEWDVHPRLSNLNVGDWTHGTRDARYTRSSDFMLGHLLAFARHDPDHARRWREVYRTTNRVVLDQFRHGSGRTGLVPDFMTRRGGFWRPVRGRWLETRHDGDFFWNAARTPWRIAGAWLNENRSKLLAPQQQMARWIRTKTHGKPQRIRVGYYVANGRNGRAIERYGDLVFTAPMAVNAMFGGRRGQRWMNRLWTSITGRDYPATTEYYGDALRLQVLLVVSGNWWAP